MALRVVAAVIGVAGIAVVIVPATGGGGSAGSGAVTGPPGAETWFCSSYNGQVWIEPVRAQGAPAPIDVVAHRGGKRAQLTRASAGARVPDDKQDRARLGATAGLGQSSGVDPLRDGSASGAG